MAGCRISEHALIEHHRAGRDEVRLRYLGLLLEGLQGAVGARLDNAELLRLRVMCREDGERITHGLRERRGAVNIVGAHEQETAGEEWAGQCEGSRRPFGLRLLDIPDGATAVARAKMRANHRALVPHDDDELIDYARERLDDMLDERLIRDLDERLGARKRRRPHPLPDAGGKDDSLHRTRDNHVEDCKVTKRAPATGARFLSEVHPELGPP